jgi:hypothetical protein
MAAILEQVFRMSLLKIAATNLAAGNLCGDCEDRNTVPMAIVQTIDEVKIAGTAAASTYCKLACQMSLGAGCKGGHLLMSHMYPLNVFTLTDCLGQPIQGIASHTIDSPYSRVHECFDKDFSYILCHCVSSSPSDGADCRRSQA